MNNLNNYDNANIIHQIDYINVKKTTFQLKNLYQIITSFMTAIPSITLSEPSLHSFFTNHLLDSNQTAQIQQFHLPQYWNNQFANFIFEKQIAVTEGSIVWIGTYKNSCERVALKITDKFQMESSQRNHQNKENDFVTQHRLNCMVQIKEIITNQEYRLMAMNYYPWNLQQIFTVFTSKKARKYTEQHISFIIYTFRSIINAISQIHQLGFVHRDLKPDNILVDSEFKIVLSDFGLITKQMQIDSSSSGTIQYLSPQRLSKKRRQNPIKYSVDIWSLGIILYQLFTGQTPYNGENEQQILQQICQGFIRRKQIPQQAMNLINGILQVNSQKRLKLQQIKKHPFLQRQIDQISIKNMINKYL